MLILHTYVLCPCQGIAKDLFKQQKVLWPLDEYPAASIITFFLKRPTLFKKALDGVIFPALDVLKICYNPDRWIFIQQTQISVLFNMSLAVGCQGPVPYLHWGQSLLNKVVCSKESGNNSIFCSRRIMLEGGLSNDSAV